MGDGGGDRQLNVFGAPLEVCCKKPHRSRLCRAFTFASCSIVGVWRRQIFRAAGANYG
jgi:hypothetical protein